MKLNYKNKKAFTLIELLIVIAIIGILFIVLVSRVDFATDKAKATGVQTDFRSFRVAFETVSKENAGFASFGWNTGDDNGDRKRNSYDEGDIGTGVGTPGYHNGKVDSGEIWTGRKVYGETWTGTYTLVNPDDMTDTSAFEALEAAINANLDPKLHITIIPDLDNGGNPVGTAKIEMANSARDPWKKEYHGAYITNAQNDGADRGALVMYSNGANGTLGSEHSIAGGNVSIVIPGNNIAGKDDYAISVFYTYANGYGETVTITNGFSNNQTFDDASSVPVTLVTDPPEVVVPSNDGGITQLPAENPAAANLDVYSWSELKALANAKLSKEDYANKYNIKPGSIKTVDGVKYMLVDLGLEAEDYDGFVFMYVLDEKIPMHHEDTQVGGYFAMDLRTYIDNIYTTMSSSAVNGLKANIKQVTIAANTGNKDASGNYLSCKQLAQENAYMFLASFTEVGYVQSGSAANKQAIEGVCFDYFAEDDQAARYSFSNIMNNKQTLYYWLRSATKSKDGFFYVGGAGVFTMSASSTQSTMKNVVCFVIG